MVAQHPGGNGLTTMESAANTGELAQPIPPPLAAGRPRAHMLRDYLALTKPRIISLLLITTVATMFVADPSGPALATLLWATVVYAAGSLLAVPAGARRRAEGTGTTQASDTQAATA